MPTLTLAPSGDCRWPILTTSDNPYDPRFEFDDWLRYDESMSYHTLSYMTNLCIDWDEKICDEDNIGWAEEQCRMACEHDIIGMATAGKVHYLLVYTDL